MNTITHDQFLQLVIAAIPLLFFLSAASAVWLLFLRRR